MTFTSTDWGSPTPYPHRRAIRILADPCGITSETFSKAAAVGGYRANSVWWTGVAEHDLSVGRVGEGGARNGCRSNRYDHVTSDCLKL